MSARDVFDGYGFRGLAQFTAIGAVMLLVPLSAMAASTVTTTTAFDYDPAGWPVKEMVEPGDSNLCLVNEYQRNSFGNITSTTTRSCAGKAPQTAGAYTEAAAPGAPAAFAPRTTKRTMSADNRFVETTTDAANLVVKLGYDPAFGRVKRAVDPNLLVSTTDYDTLGRKILETLVDGTKTKWSYVYCENGGPDGSVLAPAGGWVGPCPSVPTTVGSVVPVSYVQSTPFAADGSTQIGAYVRSYRDEIGREVRVETQGFDGAGPAPVVNRDTIYDAQGQVLSTSRPYRAGDAAYWVRFTYDSLGRVKTEDRPGDRVASGVITTYTYNGLEITKLEPAGRQTVEYRNPMGQTIAVRDAKGGTLRHAHDAAGRLTATQDQVGNVITTTYDARGRKLSLKDPDLGRFDYAYSAAGDLMSQTDAKGQVTSFAYDALGRMTDRAEPSLTSRWVYDTVYADGSACAMGKGRLCESTSNNGYSQRSLYDSLGRPVTQTTRLGSDVYNTSVSYDAQGRVARLTYPSGLATTRGYSPAGYLKEILDARNGVALWTAGAVEADGQVSQYVYGGVTTTQDQYSPMSGRLLATSAGSGGGVQSMSYTYDEAGRLSTRSDDRTGVTSSYGYDELNRLTAETRSGGGLPSSRSLGWTYGPTGNIETRTEDGARSIYNYNLQGAGNVLPHAVASVSGAVNGTANPAYKYDGNGNLLEGAGRAVTWTSFDKVASIAQGAARLDYNYGSQSQRVRESYFVNGALQRTTTYLNSADGTGLLYEQEAGVAGVKRKHYLSAGGNTFAVILCGAADCTVRANTTIQYLHHDHLGSVVAVSDAAGGVVERLAYDPFGKRRNKNGLTEPDAVVSTDRGFTEHEHLDEVGLINMNGRVFDPSLGRFLSADPNVPHAMDMQSYNRYSYLRNSPVNGTDPTGYEDGGAGEGGAAPSAPGQTLGGVTVTGTRGDAAGLGFSTPEDAHNIYITRASDGQLSVAYSVPGINPPSLNGIQRLEKSFIVAKKSSFAALPVVTVAGIARTTGVLADGAKLAVPSWVAPLVTRGGIAVSLLIYSGPSDNGEDARVAAYHLQEARQRDLAKQTDSLQGRVADTKGSPDDPDDPDGDHSKQEKVYRGGNTLEARTNDVRIDKVTGLVKPGRGVSLSGDAEAMTQRFGIAREIVSIPEELQIVRTSGNHFEIAPRTSMTMERYQQLLNQVIMK